MQNRIQKRIYEILEVGESGDATSKGVDIFITALIILNVLAVIFETIDAVGLRYRSIFIGFEVFSVIIFTIEYILRIWSCTTENKFHNPLTGRIRFALKPIVLIDLIVILPFYLPLFAVLDLRTLRALRLFRLLRVLKIGRYSTSVKTIGRVITNKKEELLISLSVIVILLIVSSSIMYYVEREAQPDAFSSIPAAMWWGVATLTTVGYGDVYPITIVGKIIGTIISFLGIMMFALPTGIVGSGFIEEIQNKKTSIVCPHCEKDIDY